MEGLGDLLRDDDIRRSGATYLQRTMVKCAQIMPDASATLLQQAEELGLQQQAEDLHLQQMAGQQEVSKETERLTALNSQLLGLANGTISKAEYLPQVVDVLVNAHSLSFAMTATVLQQTVRREAMEKADQEQD